MTTEEKNIAKWILEYRRIMKDDTTPEETVVMRIRYFRGLICRLLDEVGRKEAAKRDGV